MIDLTIIGGGIVGVAVAWRMARDYPGLSILLVEKEPALARHQTGRNSGVIHAGLYYAPGSLKAEFCRRGLTETVAFCREQGLPYDQCGKLVVATTRQELERLEALGRRAAENGLSLTRLDAAALRDAEPAITGLGALLSPETGITDYTAITDRVAALFTEAGGEIRLGAGVVALKEGANGVEIALGDGSLIASRHLIACAGLQADRIAAMAGLAGDFAIVPFKGEYYRLAPRHDHVVRHLIYPVPDPDLPFLGIHLTRMIGGYVTVGPNAVFSLARENYAKLGFDWRDARASLGFPGFWKTVAANLRAGIDETANSAFRARYLAQCRKYCPSLGLADLQPYRAGIRAQAVMRDGTLVHDFLIRATARSLHVCNAPSPAATSAMPIGAHIARMAQERFGLRPASPGDSR